MTLRVPPPSADSPKASKVRTDRVWRVGVWASLVWGSVSLAWPTRQNSCGRGLSRDALWRTCDLLRRFGCRTGLRSPLRQACFFPAVAYQMNPWGRLHVGCHRKKRTGIFFDRRFWMPKEWRSDSYELAARLRLGKRVYYETFGSKIHIDRRSENEIAALREFYNGGIHAPSPPGWAWDRPTLGLFGAIGFPCVGSLPDELAAIEQELSAGSLRDAVHGTRLTARLYDAKKLDERREEADELVQWLDARHEIARHWMAMQLVYWASDNRGLGEYCFEFVDLRNLSLRDTRISDAALQHLRELPELEWVELGHTDNQGTGIQGDGLKHLQTLPSLRYLFLTKTDVDDAALAHVSSMTGLVTLGLDFTKITDRGLKHLQGLTELRFLNLTRTKITDEGLQHLEPLNQLERLNLLGTRVTPEGVARLREALPDLQIVGAP